MSNIVAVMDLDGLKYRSAAVGEQRSIRVIHRQSGLEKIFATRTDFHGRDKRSGWLAVHNAHRVSPMQLDEFEIVDIQVAEPAKKVFHIVDAMMQRQLNMLKTKAYVGYIGQGESFRVERSSILKYKGNRQERIKPLLLDEVADYLRKKWSAQLVEGLEVDDMCTIQAYGKKTHVVVSYDKDARGCPTLFINPDKPEEGIQNGHQLGRLWLEQGKVKGRGRMWFYHQVLSKDSEDNYAANSAATRPWGEKASYHLLANCRTDEECLRAIAEGYQSLYPKPKKILGWRNHKIEVSAGYVLNENWDLARMLRFEDDKMVATDYFAEHGIIV